MGKVDWNLVETQLRATSPAAVKNDHQTPEMQTDAEVLKHIGDALRLDATNSDPAPVPRK